MKKGAFFTIDSLLAITLALIFLTFIFSNLNSVKNISPEQSYYARDSMQVLLETNSLENNTAIQLYLNNLPEQVCGKVTIYDSSMQLQNTITKTGCSSSDVIYVNWKTFVNDSIYLAKGEFWSK